MTVVHARRLLVLLILAMLVTGCATTGGGGDSGMDAEDRQKASETNTQLGIRYLRQGELQQALRKLNKAVAQNPRNAAAHMTMGVAFQRLDEPELAQEHYERAVDLAPDNSSALNNYGRFLCKSAHYEQALPLFERAAQNPLYASSELPLANAGLCARRDGRDERAEDYFLRALKANPRFAPALLEMAKLRFQGGNALSARGFYQRYLSVAAQTAESAWLGVRIENELGDQDAVASYALVLRQRFPDSSQTRKLLEWERDDGR